MPNLNITDLDNFAIQAQQTVAEWEQEFQQKFYQPLINAEQTKQLLAASPAEHAQIAQQAPIQYGRAMKRIKKMQGRLGGTGNG